MKLSPKQAKGYREANSRWNLLIGATRSGKSHLQQLIIPKRIKEQIPGLYLLMAKTLGNVESNILLPMREMYGARYVSQPYIRHGITKATVFGKEFYCLGGDNILAVNKLRGKGVGYAAVDEGPTLPADLMQMLKTRMTDDRAKADITGNPEGPLHPFKVDLIDRAKELSVYHLSFGLDDNPSLSDQAKRQLRAELTGVWFKRLILGLWVAAEGAIYDMLDLNVHVVDVFPEINQYWVCIDYGTATVTCYWLLGFGVDNKLYFVDVWRHDARKSPPSKSDLQLGTDLVNWLVGMKCYPQHIFVPGDAASFIKQLMDMRDDAKRAGQRTPLESIVLADRSPGSVLDGIRDVSTVVGVGSLLFSRRVERAGHLDEWIGYSWDPKAQQLGDDKPLKQNDHGPDAGRYGIRAISKYYPALWRMILKAGQGNAPSSK
jgi:PBSX family phage terminase large subunit